MNVHFSSSHDNWSTPKNVYNKLNEEYNFDYDPCPLGGRDGLEKDWGKRNFVNPPYSQLSKWLKKGYEESRKNKLVVMLIPSRTDTKAWHEYAMKADKIIFIKGRLKFGNAKFNAPFSSAVIVFYPHDKNYPFKELICPQ